MSGSLYMFLSVLTFVVSIPVSIWLLANLLGLLDQRPITKPLTRLVFTIICIALFLVLTHRSLGLPIALAFTLVTLCHGIAGFIFRFYALGIPVVKKDLSDRNWGGEGEPVAEALKSKDHL